MKTKIFIGRENELEQFRRTLNALIQSPDSGEYYTRTILVYGVGGMGKTELCRKFLEIAKVEYPEVVRIAINWLDKKEGCSFTPIELLDVFCDELKDEFSKEIKPYFDAKKSVKKNKEKIDHLLERDKELIDTTKPVVSATVTAVTGQLSIGTAVSEGVGFFGRLLSNEIKEHLIKKWNVRDEEIQLYESPESILVKYLLQCITTITTKRKKKILMVLDTCELIRRSEAWLMDYFLVPLVDNNPNVVLIYSGRDNTYTLRTVTIDGQIKKVYGFADKLTSHRPIAIDMKLFSEVDIRNYLREKLEQDVPDEMVRFVQTSARGVPYAVDLLTNAMQMGIKSMIQHFQNGELQSQLERSISSEDVIKTIVDRFLFYCDQDDLTKIYSLAILPDRNPDLLREIWQVQNPVDISKMLQSKYAFFVGYEKLHEVVQGFLVEHLLRNQSLREDIARSIAEKALPIYQDIYRIECEEEPILEYRFEDEHWKKAALDLMNILIWRNPSDAVDFFLKRSIELLLFDGLPFIRRLKEPLDRLLEIKVEPPLIHRKHRHQVNALMEALDDFLWWSFSGKVLSFCQKALDEWKLDPMHRSILALIEGRMRYHQNDYDAALNILLYKCDETVLEKSLKDKLAEALDAVGQKFCLDREDHFFFSEKALKAFEKVVQLNDRKSSYLYHFAVMLRQSGQAEKALPYYSKALELDPKSEHVYISQGMAFRDLHRYEDAITAYQKAIEINPKYVDAYTGLGYAYCYLGRYEDAIAAYQKAIEINPKYVDAYTGLGYAYCYLGRYEDAIAACQKAVDINPKDVDAYTGLGYAYCDLGRYEDAIAAYQKAIEINPKYVCSYLRLAWLYADLAKFDKAEEVCAKASEIDPQDPRLFETKGFIQACQNNYSKAIEYYKKAIEMKIGFLGSRYNNMGEAYFFMGQYEKAIECFKKAIEYHSKNAHTGLGYVYLVINELEMAESTLLQAIQIQRDSPGPKKNLAITYLYLEKQEQARQYFTEVVEFCNRTQNIYSQLDKVTALLGLMRFEEALQLLKQVGEKFTISPVASKNCFFDWELMASAPHPPEGIQQFLERARMILRVK